jgi:hypothetical protein
MPGKRAGSVVKPGRYETPDALSCWKAVALGGLFGGHRHCDACRYPDKALKWWKRLFPRPLRDLHDSAALAHNALQRITMATSTEGPVSVRLRIGKVVPAIDAVFTLTVN